MTELHKHRDLAEFYLAEMRTANRALADILSRGMASGEFRQMDPQATVSLIKSIALMHVLWTQFPMPAIASKTPRATIDEMVDFILHALRPDAPGAPHAPETIGASPARSTSTTDQ
jgi:hypothetical protein